MNVIRTVAGMRDAVRAARAEGATIGFVPTMGAFHAGHLSLMRAARAETGFVVVSLFVNPTQFDEPADLEAYPRDEARDAELAAAEGVRVLFAPPAEALYPPGFATSVAVDALAAPLEGAVRGAAHFRGVATVVAKLLNIVQPDAAFFGQKDAQQVAVVRAMVRDLDIPTRIVACPTVREHDGLAMSSRNGRLAPNDRPRALALRRALQAAEGAIANGARDGAAIAESARAAMRADGVEPDYLEIVSADTLRPVTPLAGALLVAVAARVGPVRLIDNLTITLPAAQ